MLLKFKETIKNIDKQIEHYQDTLASTTDPLMIRHCQRFIQIYQIYKEDLQDRGLEEIITPIEVLVCEEEYETKI